MKLQPLVSIIIPAYNRADFTVKTIQSVLAQTYGNIELIVVDNGSTDDTKDRLKVFGDKIKYLYKVNRGVCAARNLGLTHAKGEFIAFLDNDDLYLPNKVELSVNFLKQRSDYGFVHTDAYLVDAEDQIVGLNGHRKRKYQGWIRNRLLLTNFVCNPTVMLRRECFEKIGIFDEKLFIPADWDLWIRIAENYKIGYIKQPLSKYRIASGECLNNLERTKEECFQVLKKTFQRDPRISKRFRGKAMARHHLSMVQSYLVKEDDIHMKDELIAALKVDPLCFKVYAFWFYYLLARKDLKRRVKKSLLIHEVLVA